MNVRTRRWLLAPIRQWRTHQLIRRNGPSLDYPTAWALITLATTADEFAYVQQASREAGSLADAGLYHDDWDALSLQERSRRTRWLARHGRTPIQQLDITERQLKRAGLRVVDWGVPKDEASARRSRDIP
ncbi:hypothetical protein KEF29_29555 [Streptomyces tuirus]|uniref:Uncharacterized protein n=1 Tax=Streptomyces tuirus TaxID=68278 RepID=A0A941FF45_9ACTN|nr:hypothetical protein [Streptomyces tuirus]